ncbi:hypothetical protein PCE1_000355 [Barthelona sp. PCE]
MSQRPTTANISIAKIRRKIYGDRADVIPFRLKKMEIEALYHARCTDLVVRPDEGRRKRFYELVVAKAAGHNLVLSGCGFGPNSASIIGELAQKYKFSNVVLTGNTFQDEGTIAFAESLKTCDCMCMLDLRSNDIGPAGMAALFSSLQVNSSVVVLDVSSLTGVTRNRLGDEGCQGLAKLLEHNRTLSFLSLSGAGIALDGARLFGQGLALNDALEHLNIAATSINSRSMSEISSILQHMDDNYSLKTLILDDNRFGNVGLEHLSKFLSKFRSLENLSLVNCGITAPDVLCEMIHTTNIKKLNLNSNTFTPKAGKAIGDMLAHVDCSLEVLKLHRCRIHDEGSMYLFQRLANAQNPSLYDLHLSENRLGDSAGQYIEKYLEKDSCKLEHLDLSSNALTEVGGVQIADGVLKNNTLVHINLSNNRFKDESALKFLQAAREWETRTIRIIEMRLNSISLSVLESVEAHLKRASESDKSKQVSGVQTEIDHLKEDEDYMLSLCKDIEDVQKGIESMQRMTREFDVHTETVVTEQKRQIKELTRDVDDMIDIRDQKMMELSALKSQLTDLKSESGIKQQVLTAKIENFRRQRYAMVGETRRKQRQLDASESNSDPVLLELQKKIKDEEENLDISKQLLSASAPVVKLEEPPHVKIEEPPIPKSRSKKRLGKSKSRKGLRKSKSKGHIVK